MQHLSRWKLIIPLFLIIPLHTSYEDSSNQAMTLKTCIGDNASFTWPYEVHPFYAIEWRFGKIQIAQTATENLSQESLSVNESYKFRFLLLEDHKVGFNITNVTETDAGDYKCIVTLKSTDILDKLKKKLQVKGVTGRRRKRATSVVEEPLSCDADEQPPASDSSTDATIGIVVTVCIGGIVIAVVVVIVIKRKRNSRTEQGSAGPDGNCSEETGPESHKLVVHEDQTRQPEGASPDSHEPIKQVDKTH